MALALPILREPAPSPAAPALRALGLAGAEVTSPRSVRLSLTDRCDLACVYCRPHKQDGYTRDPLDLDAWVTLARGLWDAGIRRVRLTGGEPLLHPRVVEVVRALAGLGFEDLALTTNGTRLARLAEPLAAAGLHRINFSLDTLDAARFADITRGGRLGPVLEGLEAARRASFRELKLNAVVVLGHNDDELEALVRFAWDRGMTPRFLEVMAIGEGAKLQDRVVPVAEMRRRLAALLEDEPASAERDRGPARYVRARHDPRLRVGFISGTTDTFCKGCDRLRVASDGTLRPCLATDDGLAAAAPARAGDASGVTAAVHEAWKHKPDGEAWKGCTESTAQHLSIRAIGG